MSGSVNVGVKAPEFKLPSTVGREISLKSCKGKNVVLYFYPKDDTTGCTKEAIAFTELKKKFDKNNTIIFGLSKDDIKTHEKFIAKYDLKIDLLSDVDGSTCEAYGVWVEKNMYGRKYMGIERSTFLIDATGRVEKVWRKVKVSGHVEEVLESVGSLK